MEVRGSLIKFVDVTKTFESSTIIRKANFEIGRGEMVFISGPSGSGKTTLLKMIFMEERPDDGQIFVDDKDLTHLPPSHIAASQAHGWRRVQDFRLLPMSVYDNVALTLRIRGMSERSLRPIVNDTAQARGPQGTRPRVSLHRSRAASSRGVSIARGHSGRAAGPARGRADRQPRPRHGGWHKEAVQGDQHARHHRGVRDAFPRAVPRPWQPRPEARGRRA